MKNLERDFDLMCSYFEVEYTESKELDDEEETVIDCFLTKNVLEEWENKSEEDKKFLLEEMPNLLECFEVIRWSVSFMVSRDVNYAFWDRNNIQVKIEKWTN